MFGGPRRESLRRGQHRAQPRLLSGVGALLLPTGGYGVAATLRYIADSDDETL